MKVSAQIKLAYRYLQSWLYVQLLNKAKDKNKLEIEKNSKDRNYILLCNYFEGEKKNDKSWQANVLIILCKAKQNFDKYLLHKKLKLV